MLKRGLALDPSVGELHSVLGAAFEALSRLDEAHASYDKALTLQPKRADTHYNRASVLRRQGRREQALESYGAAIALAPGFAEASYNQGLVLDELGRPLEACASYDRAIAARANFAAAFFNRGLALRQLERLPAALASFDGALATRPEFAEALYSRGLILHTLNHREEAPCPLCAQRTGIWRYAPVLSLRIADRGRDARRSRSAAGAQTTTRITAGARPGDRPWRAGSGIRRALLLLSLPAIHATTLETIPAIVPYLAADPAAGALWRERLAGPQGLKVGLACAGAHRPHRPNAAAIDRRRSVSLEITAPFGEVAGVTFVSLQKGPAAVQAASPPPGLSLADFTAKLDDFADTAALVDALDLVISFDTAVAHLAGAMCKPVWLLNRYDTCWRWLLDRDDSPWYPTLRQFRQPTPGDRSGVIQSVRDALAALAREWGCLTRAT
jgi:Tfp pilus assembly protein PilF